MPDMPEGTVLLTELEIDEISGVTKPANKQPGWAVIKSEGLDAALETIQEEEAGEAKELTGVAVVKMPDDWSDEQREAFAAMVTADIEKITSGENAPLDGEDGVASSSEDDGDESDTSAKEAEMPAENDEGTESTEGTEGQETVEKSEGTEGQETVEKSEESEVVSKADYEAVVKQAQEAQKAAAEAVAKAEAVAEERALEQAVSKAAGWKLPGIEADEAGKHLRAIRKSAGDEAADWVEERLSALTEAFAKSALFAEIGATAAAERPVMKSVEEKAAALMEQREGLSKSDAMAEVMKTDRDLADRYEAESRPGLSTID